MVIVMKPKATKEDIKGVEDLLRSLNLGVHISSGSERTIIGVIGDKRLLADTPLELMPGVDRLIPIVEPYKLVSRAFKPENTVLNIKGVEIGGKQIAVIAGPCAVESEDQVLSTARFLKSLGVRFLRGGAYKPRTSPYSFQGLEEDGLKILAAAGKETGLITVSEIVSAESLHLAEKYVDMIQIGARNMQNFHLLKEVGRSRIPVILKRGLSATIEEWLNAAEYLMNEGNYNIILCERGIRTFETYTRNTLDLSSIPAVKELSHLPVIADPSHGTGKWKLVTPMSRAAIAAGADGVIVEVHPCPNAAMSDGPQSLNFESFSGLMTEIKSIAGILGREL
ncbi:MAG TPA: 3-deoxy-7-phosphoheptulonate synthase [Candidatus Atribacteria bacterium]|nr:3-deoxy-7-phosphoheptulonate synthase [Candidatus Atribacteria bacterium]HPT77586.1 3-deoxy-7-phosphoheptulonate synthase [Candidatus Atribacteria bacterium]